MAARWREKFNPHPDLEQMTSAQGVRLFLKDAEGVPILLAPLHLSWHAHVAWCQAHRRHAVIFAPWGHGKSIQMAVGYVLYRLGIDVNERIAVVTNVDDQAEKRVQMISQYITADPDYQRLFPSVHPDETRSWTNHKLYVKRQGMSIDPSVEAHGVLGSGIGSRYTGIVFDDVVDRRNAIEQPILREKVAAAIKETWLSRLEEAGWMVYIGTVWHKADFNHQLLEDRELREGYCILVQRLRQDYGGIDMGVWNCPDVHDWQVWMERSDA